VNVEGVELEHVHSIVVKVGDGRAQFDVNRMLMNLEQHSARRTRSFVPIQVLTLDGNERQVREPAAEPNSANAYALFGSINSKHNNSNTHCYPTHGHVSCHGI
jgi:hypothetical protein